MIYSGGWKCCSQRLHESAIRQQAAAKPPMVAMCIWQWWICIFPPRSTPYLECPLTGPYIV